MLALMGLAADRCDAEEDGDDADADDDDGDRRARNATDTSIRNKI